MTRHSLRVRSAGFATALAQLRTLCARWSAPAALIPGATADGPDSGDDPLHPFRSQRRRAPRGAEEFAFDFGRDRRGSARSDDLVAPVGFAFSVIAPGRRKMSASDLNVRLPFVPTARSLSLKSEPATRSCMEHCHAAETASR